MRCGTTRFLCGIALACATIACAPVSPASANPSTTSVGQTSSEVLVTLERGTTAEDLVAIQRTCATLADDGVNDDELVACEIVDDVIVDENDLEPVVRLRLAPGMSVESAVDELRGVAHVTGASENALLQPMDETVTGANALRRDAAGAALLPASTTVNDALAPSLWSLEAARLPEAWDLTRCDGSGGATVADTNVTIAVLDTGSTVDHEDLAPNLRDAYNAVDKSTDVTDSLRTNPGHGTHVCGIAAAATNNGIGVASSSYNAGLAALKVFDSEGQCYESYLVEAMSHVLSNKDDKHIRVINFSVGAPLASRYYDWGNDAFCQRITEARRQGILTVAAAGNGSGNPFPERYGDYDDCLSVINVKQSGGGYVISGTSNYNEDDVGPTTTNRTKNISAPGNKIQSTMNSATDAYGSKDGTSMASPFVAGIAALCFAEDPSLTPGDVQNLLQRTASTSRVGQTGWSAKYGYGLVDAYAAVSHIMGNTTIDPIPDQAYATGVPSSPALTVRNAEGQVLRAGTDYTVTYSNNEAIGTATATVTGCGDYAGTTSATFQIVIACNASDVNATYDGNAYAIHASAPYEGAQIRYSGDGGATFTLDEPPSYTEAGNHPTYFQVTVDELQAQGFATVRIARRPVTLTSASASKNYDGKPLTAQRVDVSGQGWVAGQGATYRVTGSQTDLGSSANTFFVTYNAGTSSSNYQVTIKNGTLTVNGVRQPMHRLYNPNSGEHFYTASATERDAVAAAGWTYEGIGWVAPQKSGTPVYRLYNPVVGDHHYTTSANERDSLVRVGWKSEGTGWYAGGSTPLWRQYNPNAVTGTHNYTPNDAERRALVALGWKDEGIAWYGL